MRATSRRVDPAQAVIRRAAGEEPTAADGASFRWRERLATVLLAACIALVGLGVVFAAVHERERFPVSPPDGWYLVMDLQGSSPEGANAQEEREWAEDMAATARRFGFLDARVWPEPAFLMGCYQPNPAADGSWEGNCAGPTSRSGYTVVLEGPYSQPATASPDPRHEWRRRTWHMKLTSVEARGAPFGVLPSLYFFSRTPRPGPAGTWRFDAVPVDKSAPVIDGRQLPDGWYTTFFPGAFTTDDKRALYAARAMAWQVRQAGYDDITIVRWPTGPATCRTWGCERGRPTVVYVIVVGRPHADAANETTEQQKARDRGLVATPFVVPLRFSDLG